MKGEGIRDRCRARARDRNRDRDRNRAWTRIMDRNWGVRLSRVGWNKIVKRSIILWNWFCFLSQKLLRLSIWNFKN